MNERQTWKQITTFLTQIIVNILSWKVYVSTHDDVKHVYLSVLLLRNNYLSLYEKPNHRIEFLEPHPRLKYEIRIEFYSC